MFEEAFRADVLEIEKSLEAMIWRIMTRASELAGAPLELPSPVVYATFDGLFQQALLRHLAGDADAIADMQDNIRRFLPACLTPRKSVTVASAKTRLRAKT